MVCHVLVVSTDQGVVLIDSGIGLKDIENPQERLGKDFVRFAKPDLMKEQTVFHRLQALGFAPSDVTDIILTHMHVDHIGGAADFPHARLHVYQEAYDSAVNPRNLIEQKHYHPEQWAYGPEFILYSNIDKEWFGLPAVVDLQKLSTNFAIIPLPGHSYGHSGVAVKDETEKWLLHCGDAYISIHQMEIDNPHCPPELERVEKAVQVDDTARIQTHQKLRSLLRYHGKEVELFCAHDPAELAKYND